MGIAGKLRSSYGTEAIRYCGNDPIGSRGKEGIERSRTEWKHSNAKVFHALEVNLVKQAMTLSLIHI